MLWQCKVQVTRESEIHSQGLEPREIHIGFGPLNERGVRGQKVIICMYNGCAKLGWSHTAQRSILTTPHEKERAMPVIYRIELPLHMEMAHVECSPHKGQWASRSPFASHTRASPRCRAQRMFFWEAEIEAPACRICLVFWNYWKGVSPSDGWRSMKFAFLSPKYPFRFPLSGRQLPFAPWMWLTADYIKTAIIFYPI